MESWVISFSTILGVIVTLLGIGVGFDSIYKDAEKRAFAQKLNARLIHAGHSTTPVFKAVFDALELILLRIFGPRVASFRFFFSTAAASILFFCTYWLLALSTGLFTFNDLYSMFAGRQGILMFFILCGSGFLTDFLSIAQTRLFLRIFQSYPAGLHFFVLAYSA